VTSEHRGSIAAPRPQLAVSLAGLLAEQAVTDLTLNSSKLAPRATDLPALLTTAAAGSILSSPGTTITLTAGGLTFTTSDSALANSLAAINR
jgi:hypothetical protein